MQACGHDSHAGDAEEQGCDDWQVPPHCIPIQADVTTFDWARLYSEVQFDVIMMDPPWQLASANPSRGAALACLGLPLSIVLTRAFTGLVRQRPLLREPNRP